jgi:hypothetical protein
VTSRTSSGNDLRSSLQLRRIMRLLAIGSRADGAVAWDRPRRQDRPVASLAPALLKLFALRVISTTPYLTVTEAQEPSACGGQLQSVTPLAMLASFHLPVMRNNGVSPSQNPGTAATEPDTATAISAGSMMIGA